MGLGPMTGRAAGYCAGYPVPGFMNPIPGWGRGRGWGRWFPAMGIPGAAPVGGWPGYGVPPYGPASSRRQEAQMLKVQAEQFEASLAEIRKRIAELETAQQEKEG